MNWFAPAWSGVVQWPGSRTFTDAIGTGFLVEGRALHPALPELVLVTNGHVVPEDLARATASWCSTGSSASGAAVAAPRGAVVVVPGVARPGLDVTSSSSTHYPAEVIPSRWPRQLPNLAATTRRGPT